MSASECAGRGACWALSMSDGGRARVVAEVRFPSGRRSGNCLPSDGEMPRARRPCSPTRSTYPPGELDDVRCRPTSVGVLGEKPAAVPFDQPGVGASDPFTEIATTSIGWSTRISPCSTHSTTDAGWMVRPESARGRTARWSHPSRRLGAALLNPVSPAAPSEFNVAAITDRESRRPATANSGRADGPAHWA